ncbi:hypothetical protein PybrP1_006386 [[Pythium] brassicae (nom. inval.)]|nr:hypothetical protein PybrP1_006386 [[Pythium] brassicae (nom. inval.)]
MCASKTTGYQGFRSFAVQECATLKPGETYASRSTKFSAMGSRIVTPPEMNRVGRHAHESIGMQSTQHVSPSDYRVPDKRGVMAHEKLPESKPFLATSTYQQDFADFEEQMRAVLRIPVESYASAFQAIANTHDNNSAAEPTIALRDVPRVLAQVLSGVGNATRVVEMFVSRLDRKSGAAGAARDQIGWESFRGAAEHVHSVFEHELDAFTKNLKRTGSCTGFELAIKVIPATTPASSYKIDYGAYGDQPRDRPYMRKRGMASTTADLTPGTSQNTQQIPGYAGFLPRAQHNPHALAQADGAVLHSPRDDLRLYHSDNLPGYTGHKPVDCANYRGECRAGSDPSTTTGAGYHQHF